MSPSVAEIRTLSRSGEFFVAEDCRLADGLLTASGRWVRPLGPDRQSVGEVESYSWPVKELRQVRWLGEAHL